MYNYTPDGKIFVRGRGTTVRDHYSYVPDGGLESFGCARVQKDIFVFYKWGERSIVYLKHKAINGCIEKVAIKRVVINNKYGKYIPIYCDTLNSLYGENELITETEARSLVQTYIDKKNSEIARAARNCEANSI